MKGPNYRRAPILAGKTDANRWLKVGSHMLVESLSVLSLIWRWWSRNLVDDLHIHVVKAWTDVLEYPDVSFEPP